MAEGKDSAYLLGLDIGSSSIGWALIELDGTKPRGITRTGVRVFEAGIEGDVEGGRGEPRNTARRGARQQRRLLDRRARRMKKLLHLLQRHGLLPDGLPEQVIPELDATLKTRHAPQLGDGGDSLLSHVLPYWLRSRALDEKLEPHELGRALYHLAQRRGFLSNRKARKKDEEKGKVKEAIGELQQKMTEAGARTLGEYFSKLDPQEERIRNRYTSRKMYEDEFEKIWGAQSQYQGALLTDELKAQVHRAIFYQRPLKKQKHLIGHCELEPQRKRAPWATLICQRFRLLQQVNNTRVITADGEERRLTTEERAKLSDTLETQGDVTFAKARRALALSTGCSFNWESGGEKRFPGNRTNAKLAAIFGDRWWQLSEDDRRRVVEDVLTIEKEDVLRRRGAEVWGLEPEAANALAQLELEPGYCRHSRRALRKLLPHLEQGLTYMEAVERAYPDHRERKQALDALPRVSKAAPELRNPIVARALTELRTLVNGIIREHGKPALVRIELAREMRKSAQQRQDTWKRNRQNEKERQQAAQKVLEETGIANPSRTDIQKVLLYQECKQTCPYTGKHISMAALLGDNPQFDVEHIIPFDRSLNDSFINKTLCEANENRSRKRNRTPYEAYGGDAKKWNEIIERVKGFHGSAARAKLALFQTQDVQSLDDFISQQLNDTKYASTLAADYLALLYGGRSDQSGKLRVQASRGGITAHLRNAWELNAILGDGGEKSRDDHRHHAVDAIVTALSDPAAIKKLSDAARSEWRWWRADFEPPWEGFLNDVRNAIDGIVVSHRVSRKVNGPLHEETIYSAPRDNRGDLCEDGQFVHVRKKLEDITKPDLDEIVDEPVRKRILAWLDQAGGDMKKAFANPDNHPFLETKDGRRVPIHKVRVRKAQAPIAVGQGSRERYVFSGSNHHLEILETTDKKGRTRWEGALVSRYEAMRRLRAGEPVVQRDHGADKRFIFSLAGGETVRMHHDEGDAQLYTVTVISQTRKGTVTIEFLRNRDARLSRVIRKTKGARVRKTPQSLLESQGQKVLVTPLGEVRAAND